MKGSYDKTLLSVQFLQVVKRPDVAGGLCQEVKTLFFRRPIQGKAYVPVGQAIYNITV
ncbi:hypothetical protein SDC9_145913 [bioreactor metagenome]|uniref:Uncharacterized protein n=1 Tax=bioreactor metagenome TaxID=1076179 RepID=A0A645E9P2_9ZZZZ